MPRATKVKVSNHIRTDKELELYEWMGMNHRTLVLKCDQYNLNPKGKKEVLAKRLLTHFTPEIPDNAGYDAPGTKKTISQPVCRLSTPRSLQRPSYVRKSSRAF